MRRDVAIIALIFMLLNGAALAQSRGVNGQKYLEFSGDARGFYTIGFVGGLQIGGIQPQGFATVARCVENMSYGQMEAIITKYVNDHPERWDNAIAALAFVALQQACASR